MTIAAENGSDATDWHSAALLAGPGFGYGSPSEAMAMSKLRGVGVGLVFLVGCAVGGAAGRIVVPPASAQQAATLTKWEYYCFDGNDAVYAKDVMPKANMAGSKGWEMVTVVGHAYTWCFKRPKL